MSFSSFFSEQARKPSGLFGRFFMSLVFDKGNAFLNNLVNELMAVKPDDHILEIGFGTGKLIHTMAKKLNGGLIEGVDFSNTMLSVAQKRNQKFIDAGIVKLFEGNFDELPFKGHTFTKACSVNTLYFWPEPVMTVKKVADLLIPGGKYIVAFEDIKQLQQRNLSDDIFRLYTQEDVENLLWNAGFSGDVRIESRKKGNMIFHCAVAIK